MAQVSNRKPYYTNVRIQIGENGEEKTYKVDRKLKDAIMRSRAPQGGGGVQTSQKELSRIVKNIVDGNRYAEAERALVQMLFQATDDRKHVYLNGKRIRITDPAEKAFVHAMHSFFGGLKGKSDIAKIDGLTATNLVQSFAESQAAQQAG